MERGTTAMLRAGPGMPEMPLKSAFAVYLGVGSFNI